MNPSTIRSAVCLIAGGLWAIGWWLLIDAAVWTNSKDSDGTPTLLAYFFFIFQELLELLHSS